MKGDILANHIPLNKFEFRVVGLVTLTTLSVSGIEEELEVAELPDRTVASTGERKPTEFDIAIPMHHDVEFGAMEVWYQESSDPVMPTYKKPCTLIHKDTQGNAKRSFTLVGVFPKKRMLPDLDRTNEGEIAMVTYTMSCDDVVPI